jgi:hypothetical protein
VKGTKQKTNEKKERKLTQGKRTHEEGSNKEINEKKN